MTFVENATVFNRKYQPAKQAHPCTPEEQEEAGETPIQETEDSCAETKNVDVMSTVLATMWLGDQNGMIHIHSSVANWNQCLMSVKLADAVIGIV